MKIQFKKYVKKKRERKTREERVATLMKSALADERQLKQKHSPHKQRKLNKS